MVSELKKTKFTTNSGAEYYYLSDLNIVLSKEGLENAPERDNFYRNLSGFGKKDAFDDNSHEYTAKDIRTELLKNGLFELAIEVTSACNFRCKYCIYSGEYKNQRVHQSKNMEPDIAYKAIDQYLKLITEGENFNSDRIPVISFYGGEPLVNFELIRSCTQYAKKRYNGNIYFTLTTNASLMNDEIIDFFVKENFNVIVSLDGYKENHDKNRVDVMGNPTFDKVMSNIKKLYAKQKSPVFVSVVYDYDTDFVLMNKFFKENDFITCLSVNGVNPYGTTFLDKYTPEDYDRFNKKVNLLMEEFLTNVRNSETRPLSFISRVFGDICTSTFMRQCDLNEKNNKFIKYTGSCVPGNKIFVDYKGDYYICEKISRSFTIGNVLNGLDYEKIAAFVNRYNKYVTTKCRDCLIKNNCKRCFISMDIDEDQIDIPSQSCQKQVANFFSDLKFAYSIFELNPKWIGRYYNQYYDTIDKITAVLK